MKRFLLTALSIAAIAFTNCQKDDNLVYDINVEDPPTSLMGTVWVQVTPDEVDKINFKWYNKCVVTRMFNDSSQSSHELYYTYDRKDKSGVVNFAHPIIGEIHGVGVITENTMMIVDPAMDVIPFSSWICRIEEGLGECLPQPPET